MAEADKQRCRDTIPNHLHVGLEVSMAGDFFDINAPIEDRIPGVIVEPITTAGTVKVRWKIDQTFSHVHHTQLMHFEIGET